MAKIKFRIDLLAPEKFPSEILASLIREHNEGIANVKFPTSQECLIEGYKIRIKKSDIEKALYIIIPIIPNWYEYLVNEPMWEKSIIEVEGNIKIIEDELIIEEIIEPNKNERRKLLKIPINLNLVANIQSEKDYEGFNGVITDINEDGLGIVSTKIPDLDQMIEISFEFQNKNIGLKFENAKAIVQWSRNDLNRFGARWIELKEDEKKILKWLTPTTRV